MKYRVHIDGREREVDVAIDEAGGLTVSLDGVAIDADVIRVPDGLNVRIDGRVFDLAVGGPASNRSVALGSARGVVRIDSERDLRRRRDGAGAGATGDLRAPMPGRVVKILIDVGDDVEAGQPIIVVEAMKMENELRAAGDGTVEKIHVETGQNVEGNAVLVSIS